MAVTKQEDKLVEAIYKFYSKNQNQCNREYQLAMDRDISDIYERLEPTTFSNELTKVSVVILTANKFEKNILHQHVYKGTKKKILSYTVKLFEKPDMHNYTDVFFFEWNGYKVFHIACRVTGSYTIGGSADAIRYCINNPYVFPTAFISFGICFGCREENDHLCDTVISRKAYPYFIGAKIDGARLKTSDDYVLSTDSDLENSINRLVDMNKFEGFDFNVNFHNYITGEAVVSSRQLRDIFVGTTTQDIYAGDMEAYGLYKESNNAYRNMPCIVIKSICDWGIAKNLCKLSIYKKVMGHEESEDEIKKIKDKLQALSACNSFSVLDILLKERVFEQSIYYRIKERFLTNEHEHVWAKTRIRDEAKKMNNEIHNILEDGFVDRLCENFEAEGIARSDEKYLQRIEGVRNWRV